MKNLAMLFLYPILIVGTGIIGDMGRFLKIPYLVNLANKARKGNTDIIYLWEVFLATFKYRKWWMISWWGLFTEKIGGKDWTQRYNQWPKKTKRQGGGNAMP